MALEMNTIGVKLGYAIETTGGRPTSGYTNIPDITDVPEIGSTPTTIEVTNLVDTYKRYISGVKDAGSDMQFGANLTAPMKTAWTSAVTAANSAWTSGKSCWWEISIPGFDSFYFAGLPQELGTSAMGVDAKIEAQLHIIPNNIAGWAAKST